MVIGKHTVPSLTYSLEVEGQLVEQTDATNPLKFLAGIGMMIPGFERQLEGKKAGDKYDITVNPEEGYGDIDQEAIIELSKEIFSVEGVIQDDLLFVGNSIPMQDNNGVPMNGKVVEILADSVKLDFNHELAGKTLRFTGEILEVREATEEELAHGHAH